MTGRDRESEAPFPMRGIYKARVEDERKMDRSAEIIAGLEAEGMKYLGRLARKMSPEEWAISDAQDERARARNAGVTWVITGDSILCFEKPDVYPGPRSRRDYVRGGAAA